jgi:hypothetical protein
MPEFILNMGTPEAASKFKELSEFNRGYIEAAFWTSSGDAEDGDLHEASFAELEPKALAEMLEACLDFERLAGPLLDHVYILEKKDGNLAYSPHQAGVDFWLTRNGHGAGFWDRGLGEVGNQLTRDAKSFGSCDLYRGDDNLIYVT